MTALASSALPNIASLSLAPGFNASSAGPTAVANAVPATREAAPSVKSYDTGVVKQVLDTGSVVIRGFPKNGPPPERTLFLADVDIPRLGRRSSPTTASTADEPGAWAAREFLRKAVVGKTVLFSVGYTVNSGREFGHVLYGSSKPDEATNLVYALVTAGLAKVRETSNDSALRDAENVAKSAGLGLWAAKISDEIRTDIIYDVENPRHLVDSLAGQQVPAVVEHVRDGSTVRLALLIGGSGRDSATVVGTKFHYITLMLSGIRSPATSEAFGAEAHFFTESRLLQRDVTVTLESVNNKILVGTVLHPAGNIAELLLRQGLAKCIDWSLRCTQFAEKYRQAEKDAQKGRLRLWKDVPSSTASSSAPTVGGTSLPKTFTGKVVEVINGDALHIRRSKHESPIKIYLSSIKPPKGDPASMPSGPGAKNFRPLADVPFMLEAREFLRKKLIHQNVHVIVDYVQPPLGAGSGVTGSAASEGRICCTVTVGGNNVAEALVSRGLATVVRYAADNDKRSAHYDDLLAAQEKAVKSARGLHEKKAESGANAATTGSTSASKRRLIELSGDVAKAKQFLPFLLRAGRLSAVVEFVASASRFRLYVPRESCVLTFLLGGISAPRSSSAGKSEPLGDEALAHVKEMILQTDVEIEIESMDRGGNFIGYMTASTHGQNMSVHLVEEGFAKVFMPNSEAPLSAKYSGQLLAAQDRAKRDRKRQWTSYDPDAEEADEQQQQQQQAAVLPEDVKSSSEVDYKKIVAERKLDLISSIVTNVKEIDSFDGGDMQVSISVQHVADGPKLDTLMSEMRAYLESNPAMPGAYKPKKGELCVARFCDGLWYRAKIVRLTQTEVEFVYIDYGNHWTGSPAKDCAAIPTEFAQQPAFVKEYILAYASLPIDDDYRASCMEAIHQDLADRPVNVHVEAKSSTQQWATLYDGVASLTSTDDPMPSVSTDNAGGQQKQKKDIMLDLVTDGLAMVCQRSRIISLARQLRLKSDTLTEMLAVHSGYVGGQDEARKQHRNIWQFGDITEDNAREFGLGSRK